jgi:hypothetical protein
MSLQIGSTQSLLSGLTSAAMRRPDQILKRPTFEPPPPPPQQSEAERRAEMEARLLADNAGGPGLGPPLSGQPQWDNDVSHLRAEIKIGDKVVARIYNSGGVEVADGYGYLCVKAGFGGAQEGTTVGPDLGDMRIAALKNALPQADVMMADTALTQAQWLAEKTLDMMSGAIVDRQA